LPSLDGRRATAPTVHFWQMNWQELWASVPRLPTVSQHGDTRDRAGADADGAGLDAPDRAAPGDELTDGRRARRARNVELAVRAARELFLESTALPTIETVAARSGISLRSLYRYFGDGTGLLEAAIDQSFRETRELVRLDHPGEGSLDDRIRAFVRSRLALHEANGPSYRVTTRLAPTVPRLRDVVAAGRRQLREQLEQQFAPELDRLDPERRLEVASAAEALCQLESLALLRIERGLDMETAERVLCTALGRLVSGT
jgi:AcrR family transcriptional regulator